MKSLIIPDVHLKIARVKSIVDKYAGVDEYVFLSDWFDSFPSKHADLPGTVEFLNENHERGDFCFVFGNHDLQYAYPRIDGLKCSGWTEANALYISKNLDKLVWESFTFIEDVQDWFVSHAGIHETMLPADEEPIEDLVHRIEYRIFAALERGEVCPEIGPGWGRGGRQRVGGVTWLDWDTEFQAIPGVNQIVGHSNGQKPRMIRTQDSENWCIDTGLCHVAIVEDGKLTIEPFNS